MVLPRSEICWKNCEILVVVYLAQTSLFPELSWSIGYNSLRQQIIAMIMENDLLFESR
jgi:hypothetical protein